MKFDKYFSTYEATDSPPIETEEYQSLKQIYDTYKSSTNPTLPYTVYNTETTNTGIIHDNDDLIEQSNTFNTNYNNSVQYNQTNTLLNNVVDLARTFIGTKYSWGGMTPSTGFDCSGLIYYIYKQNGISLPRTAKEMESVGSEVKSLSDVKIGDIICTPGSGKSGKHVKIVSKVDNGQIYTIEAKGKKYGIIETPLTNTSNITSIRRVINNQRSNNYIINYFLNKGLTLEQAKGIYGNLMQESGGDISVTSRDGYNSYGLAQWTGERKQRLFNMFGQNPTAKQQLDFLWWELNNTHREAFNKLKQTTTTNEATKVFMDEFERPNKRYANFNRRLQYANSIS